MAPNKQQLAKLDTQQQNSMEGEPVRQTRRGVEPRPPEDENEKTGQLDSKTGGSQNTIWRRQITWKTLEILTECQQATAWDEEYE